VCAGVMQRADARSVCTAFSAALARHGVPDQLLTDNGRVFTGRLTRPHPAVVLFDRICQQQGIRHLLTKPAQPTTTGKIERFHRTLRVELLDNAGFTSLEAAQLGINAYIVHYNTERPHQALGGATPAERFTYDETARAVAPPVTDAELLTLLPVAQPGVSSSVQLSPDDDPNAIRRAISSVGYVRFAGAQYHLGRRLGRRIATVVPDKDLVRRRQPRAHDPTRRSRDSHARRCKGGGHLPQQRITRCGSLKRELAIELVRRLGCRGGCAVVRRGAQIGERVVPMAAIQIASRLRSQLPDHSAARMI